MASMSADAKYLGKIKKISLSILERGVKGQEKPEKEYHQKILATIDKGQFGCQSDNVIAFANAFCDFDFIPFVKRSDKHFEHGTVLKILDAPIEAYKPNSLICVFYRGNAYSVADCDHHGSDIELSDFGSKIRLATKEEIEDFFTKVEGQRYFLSLMDDHSCIKRD